MFFRIIKKPLILLATVLTMSVAAFSLVSCGTEKINNKHVISVKESVTHSHNKPNLAKEELITNENPTLNINYKNLFNTVVENLKFSGLEYKSNVKFKEEYKPDHRFNYFIQCLNEHTFSAQALPSQDNSMVCENGNAVEISIIHKQLSEIHKFKSEKGAVSGLEENQIIYISPNSFTYQDISPTKKGFKSSNIFLDSLLSSPTSISSYTIKNNNNETVSEMENGATYTVEILFINKDFVLVPSEDIAIGYNGKYTAVKFRYVYIEAEERSTWLDKYYIFHEDNSVSLNWSKIMSKISYSGYNARGSIIIKDLPLNLFYINVNNNGHLSNGQLVVLEYKKISSSTPELKDLNNVEFIIPSSAFKANLIHNAELISAKKEILRQLRHDNNGDGDFEINYGNKHFLVSSSKIEHISNGDDIKLKFIALDGYEFAPDCELTTTIHIDFLKNYYREDLSNEANSQSSTSFYLSQDLKNLLHLINSKGFILTQNEKQTIEFSYKSLLTKVLTDENVNEKEGLSLRSVIFMAMAGVLVSDKKENISWHTPTDGGNPELFGYNFSHFPIQIRTTGCNTEHWHDVPIFQSESWSHSLNIPELSSEVKAYNGNVELKSPVMSEILAAHHLPLINNMNSMCQGVPLNEGPIFTFREALYSVRRDASGGQKMSNHHFNSILVPSILLNSFNRTNERVSFWSPDALYTNGSSWTLNSRQSRNILKSETPEELMSVINGDKENNLFKNFSLIRMSTLSQSSIIQSLLPADMIKTANKLTIMENLFSIWKQDNFPIFGNNGEIVHSYAPENYDHIELIINLLKKLSISNLSESQVNFFLDHIPLMWNNDYTLLKPDYKKIISTTMGADRSWLTTSISFTHLTSPDMGKILFLIGVIEPWLQPLLFDYGIYSKHLMGNWEQHSVTKTMTSPAVPTKRYSYREYISMFDVNPDLTTAINASMSQGANYEGLLINNQQIVESKYLELQQAGIINSRIPYADYEFQIIDAHSYIVNFKGDLIDAQKHVIEWLFHHVLERLKPPSEAIITLNNISGYTWEDIISLNWIDLINFSVLEADVFEELFDKNMWIYSEVE